MPGRSITRFCLGAALAAGLGACSTDIQWNQINLVPKFYNPFGADPLSFRGAGGESLRPVTAEDLVTADGQCTLPQAIASASAQADNTAPVSAAPSDAGPTTRGGVALQMTECEVVTRAGAMDKVDIGANERNERAVTLTYMRGPWPGIYRFAEGRLVTIERVAEPPKPKAAPKAKTQKKRA